MKSALHLTPRDVEILAFLGEYGVVPSTLIHERWWSQATLRACQNRLKRLTDHGVVLVMESRRRTGRAQGGKLPLVFGLTRSGADVVSAETGCAPRRVLHRPLSDITLAHRLDIVRTRLAWDRACEREGLAAPVWFLDSDGTEREDDSPAVQRLLSYRFDVDKQRVLYQPDAVSLTWLQTQPDKPATALVSAWEIDRHTEGHRQLREKLPGLDCFIQRKAHRRHWPDIEPVIVRSFWVTNSRRRISEICQRLPRHDVIQFLRLAELPSLQTKCPLRSPVWATVQGEFRSVLS